MQLEKAIETHSLSSSGRPFKSSAVIILSGISSSYRIDSLEFIPETRKLEYMKDSTILLYTSLAYDALEPVNEQI